MSGNRVLFSLFVMSAVALAWCLPCGAAQKDEKSIWTNEEPRGAGRGPGGPGGQERVGRGGPGGPDRFELRDEDIDRIMDSLKKSDPNVVTELEKLRKEDPEKFQAELRKYGREEYGKILRERADSFRRRRQSDFQQWLIKEYPKEAENLAKLKENDPNLYMERFETIRDRYWRIFDEERRNPELAEVLKEDLELKDKVSDLVVRIKTTTNEQDKKKLMAELEGTVGRRYDLIVRQKEIAYERLLKWLEELRNRIKESRDEIVQWQNEQAKAENVKNHMKDLLGENPKFRWD
jgi:hypothetical protein